MNSVTRQREYDTAVGHGNYIAITCDGAAVDPREVLDELAALRAATRETEVKPACNWKYIRFYDNWETGCGNRFVIYNGTPGENDMCYCPYCGGKLTA